MYCIWSIYTYLLRFVVYIEPTLLRISSGQVEVVTPNTASHYHDFHRWPRICTVYRVTIPFFFTLSCLILEYDLFQDFNTNNTTVANSGAGTAYSSGAPYFGTDFSGFMIVGLVVCVVFYGPLFVFSPFFLRIVCLSLICGFCYVPFYIFKLYLTKEYNFYINQIQSVSFYWRELPEYIIQCKCICYILILCLYFQIKQVKSSFAFGTAVRADIMMDPNAKAYHDFVYNNFEWAVIANNLKWRLMEFTKVVLI